MADPIDAVLELIGDNYSPADAGARTLVRGRSLLPWRLTDDIDAGDYAVAVVSRPGPPPIRTFGSVGPYIERHTVMVETYAGDDTGPLPRLALLLAGAVYKAIDVGRTALGNGAVVLRCQPDQAPYLTGLINDRRAVAAFEASLWIDPV